MLTVDEENTIRYWLLHLWAGCLMLASPQVLDVDIARRCFAKVKACVALTLPLHVVEGLDVQEQSSKCHMLAP